VFVWPSPFVYLRSRPLFVRSLSDAAVETAPLDRRHSHFGTTVRTLQTFYRPVATAAAAVVRDTRQIRCPKRRPRLGAASTYFDDRDPANGGNTRPNSRSGTKSDFSCVLTNSRIPFGRASQPPSPHSWRPSTVAATTATALVPAAATCTASEVSFGRVCADAYRLLSIWFVPSRNALAFTV